ncbi:MAG: hypothetical protein JWM89_1404 [Acidimicrobiales bacterium]|nr:hypothetical protein [Acidimicrobiales bacterium]
MAALGFEPRRDSQIGASMGAVTSDLHGTSIAPAARP